MLYLRSALALDPGRARSGKRELVENERLRFSTRETCRDLTEVPDVEPLLGKYPFTLRAFGDGYVARVIDGEEGILVTTDAMDSAGLSRSRDGPAVSLDDERRFESFEPSRGPCERGSRTGADTDAFEEFAVATRRALAG